jgi:hypothetical protein
VAGKKKEEKKARTLEVAGREAQVLYAALHDLSNNRMPVRLSVRISRWMTAVGEYVEPLDENLRSLFKECSDGSDRMAAGSKAAERFNDESQVFLDEVYEIELTNDTIGLPRIEGLESVEVSPQTIQKLMEHGLITD